MYAGSIPALSSILGLLVKWYNATLSRWYQGIVTPTDRHISRVPRGYPFKRRDGHYRASQRGLGGTMKVAVVFAGHCWLVLEGLTQSTMELVRVCHSFESAQNVAYNLEPEKVYYHTSEESFKNEG